MSMRKVIDYDLVVELIEDGVVVKDRKGGTL